MWAWVVVSAVPLLRKELGSLAKQLAREEGRRQIKSAIKQSSQRAVQVSRMVANPRRAIAEAKRRKRNVLLESSPSAIEKEATQLVHNIADEKIDETRIKTRLGKDYRELIVDGDSRNPLVRLYLKDPAKLEIGFFDGDTVNQRVQLETVRDILTHRERIEAAALKYS